METGLALLIHDAKGPPVASDLEVISAHSVRTTMKSTAGLWIASIFILCLIPSALMFYKASDLPLADILRQIFTLETFSAEHPSARYILLAPLGAVFIVFLRLTLGIRVLGPFRSILLAIAFQVTGILTGLFFLALVVGVVVAARPIIRQFKLPYFGRTSAILGIVSVIIIVSVMVGQRFAIPSLTQAIYFPMVVLCLTADGFIRTIHTEGHVSALWRGSMTALAAVLLALIASNEAVRTLLSRYPELALLEIGMILVISKYFAFRLLSRINPVPVKGKQKKSEHEPDIE